MLSSLSFIQQSLEILAPMGPLIAGLQCFDFSTVPAVWWNSRGIDSMPKLAVNVFICLLGFELGFWQSFDHKNVLAVLGIYLGFAKRSQYPHFSLVHYLLLSYNFAMIQQITSYHK